MVTTTTSGKWCGAASLSSSPPRSRPLPPPAASGCDGGRACEPQLALQAGLRRPHGAATNSQV
jgi:hypothetical protein